MNFSTSSAVFSPSKYSWIIFEESSKILSPKEFAITAGPLFTTIFQSL